MTSTETPKDDSRQAKKARRIANRRARMGIPGLAEAAAPAPRAEPSLEDRVKRLADETELLRAKLLQLHRAVIASGALKPAPLGSAEGEAVPEERLLNGHDRAVLAFGGMAGRLQMPPAEFARTFADRPVDLIFYKDLQQCWYQQGLLGMTADIPATVDYIGRTIAAQGWSRICTVGTSAGGYAAILFGVLLRVEHIVAFSPQTLLGQHAIRKFASTDSRERDIDLRGQYLDLAKVIEQTDYAGQIDIYFGTRNEMDVLAADWLRRFPRVTLHPVDTEHHNTAQRVREAGGFRDAFRFLD